MIKAVQVEALWITASAIAASMATIVSPACAQANAAEEADSPSGDIIVTARKREESIQSVPFSISAVSGEDLLEQGAKSFEDFARTVPGVSFRASGGDGSRPVIRGVSSIAGSPTVAIYLDDAPIHVRGGFRGTGGAADIKLVDIERIEVLRGPQGTLYGGNSLGGAIKYVTRAPSLTATELTTRGEVSFTDGGDPSYLASVTAGAPIVADRIGIRASVMWERDGGWIDQVAPVTGALVKRNADQFDYLSGRVALLLQPTETLSVTASYFGQRKDVDALSYSNSSLGIGKYENILPETVRETFHLGSVKATNDFDFAQLYAQVSYYHRDFKRAEDYTAAFADFGLPTAWGPFSNGGVQNQKTWTGELRLSSSGAGLFGWTFGAYYYDSKLFSEQSILGGAGAPGLIFRSQNDANDQQYAVFGEASYKLHDSLTLLVGGRYSWLKVNTIRDSQGLLGGGDAANLTRKEKSFDPKINLSWQFGDNGLAYAQAAKGFRAGQGSALLPNSCQAELTSRGIPNSGGFGSDKLWTYEAGLKMKGADGRVRINSSVYQTNWDDKPETVILSSCGFGATIPVGKVRIRGLEFESAVSPVPGWNIGLNVGYTDARYKVNEPTAAVFDGDRLASVSPWTLSASTDYRIPIGNDSATIRLDYVWRDSLYIESPSTVRPSTVERKTDEYGILNGRVSYDRSSWSVYVFVQNLLNDHPVVDRESLRPASANQDRITSIRPRTLGIGFTADF